MQINEKAADFTLNGVDKNGNEIKFTLSDYFGKNVVLFFYPKDDMPGCTLEAADFSNNFEYLDELVEIVGISSDSIESHKNFQKNMI